MISTEGLQCCLGYYWNDALEKWAGYHILYLRYYFIIFESSSIISTYSKKYNIIKSYFKKYNVACKNGFLCRNCAQPCPEPFYGPGCRFRCFCNTSTEYCHHVIGWTTSSSRGNLDVLQSKQCVSWYIDYCNKCKSCNDLKYT